MKIPACVGVFVDLQILKNMMANAKRGDAKVTNYTFVNAPLRSNLLRLGQLLMSGPVANSAVK